MEPVRDSTKDLRLLSELALACPSLADITMQVRAISKAEGDELLSALSEQDLQRPRGARDLKPRDPAGI